MMEPEPHAYARIVSVRFQPDALDAAMAYFRDVSVPLVRAQPGSRSITGLGNRETGDTFAISFWRSLEDLEGSNSPPDVVDAMAGYAQWMRSSFVVESFDVVHGVVPEPAALEKSGDWVRLTSIVATQGSRDDLVATVRQQLDTLETGASSCTGTLLMAQRGSHRLVALEFWTSHAAMAATQARAHSLDQRALRHGLVQSLPVRHMLEVFGRY
jgi:quinol monooxygenase YgiN